MPNREPILPPASTSEVCRAKAIVVVRESTLYDRVLMEGMIGQTVSQALHLPGAADVLAAGIAPLDGTSDFETFHHRKNDTRVALFEHEGVVYLYCTGSAATMNTPDSDNQFVQFLCEVLETYRPETLYAATFSRLVRSIDFNGRLYQALRLHAGTIQVAGTVLDLHEPHGKAMWSVYSMIADMERSEIVKRLFAGQVFRYLQGKFLFGEESLPPGYRLDGGIVMVDEAMVTGVRVLLEAMADTRLTARQVVDVAGEAGVTSATIRRLHGPDATFADLCRADSRVASLIDWLPTYATGHAEICHQNPYPGATQFHSLVVEGATRTNPGFVRFEYDWPVPDGGWADPDLIAAAARRTTGRKERRRTGGAAHQRRKPLSGWVSWQDADNQYRISGTSDHYVILRQPQAPEEDPE